MKLSTKDIVYYAGVFLLLAIGSLAILQWLNQIYLRCPGSSWC